MGKQSFTKGVHRSQIIWHRAQNVAGQVDCSIETALFTGQVIYANGERGTYIGAEVVGVVGDPEVFRGNAIIVLEDGSISNQTFEGKTETINGPDSFVGTGTWRMASGTGRFAYLRGGGQFKWSLVGDRYEDEFSD